MSFEGAVSAGLVFEPSLNGLGGFGFVALFGLVEFFGLAGGLGVACDPFFAGAGGLGLVCDPFFAGAGGLGVELFLPYWVPSFAGLVELEVGCVLGFVVTLFIPK